MIILQSGSLKFSQPLSDRCNIGMFYRCFTKRKLISRGLEPHTHRLINETTTMKASRLDFRMALHRLCQSRKSIWWSPKQSPLLMTTIAPAAEQLRRKTHKHNNHRNSTNIRFIKPNPIWSFQLGWYRFSPSRLGGRLLLQIQHSRSFNNGGVLFLTHPLQQWWLRLCACVAD